MKVVERRHQLGSLTAVEVIHNLACGDVGGVPSFLSGRLMRRLRSIGRRVLGVFEAREA